jgi:hypothetical protein
MTEEKSRVTVAFEVFMMELFGEIPSQLELCEIDRETYTKEMKKVQERFDLVPGDPDFLEWVLTLTGRSPKIIEGAENNEPT